MKVAWVACLLVPTLAFADDSKRCVDVQFTPTDNLQIVAWIETAAGGYVDTIYVTQQIGSFGLGNRPGRWDFNSGPLWPYGRRITTFPVWAHRHGQTFPAVLYQNDESDDPDACFTADAMDYQSCGENDLSHPFDQSSREQHFCRPLMPTEAGWDAGTCATTAFTDKGRFSATATALYPPRADVDKAASDSTSVAMFKTINPFDAVSQPTPLAGTASHAPWPVPSDLPAGNYVLWVETAKEADFNTAYNATVFPPPAGIAWTGYGQPYLGQPSVVYSVPFAIGDTTSTAATMTYAGYGDPVGVDGDVRPPDATITSDTPGTGASRLQLVAGDNGMYRVRVDTTAKSASDLPGLAQQLGAVNIDTTSLTVSFMAPGLGTSGEAVTGYDVRVRASEPLTDDNFDDSTPVTAHVVANAPGTFTSFEISGLLPQTDYWVGIRAYDGCHNSGDIAIVKLTTAVRVSGAVDACFVATAAYGSIMANDVEVLRHFRDSYLQTNALGELAVEAYYTFGPSLAGVVGESDLLRSSTRELLAPIVARVRKLSF